MRAQIVAALAGTTALLFNGVICAPTAPTYAYMELEDPSALCLDGSRYGVFVCKANTNVSWEFAVQGGGWCYDENSCGARAETPLGSSKTWPATHQQCLDDGVNYVLMLYCDGASFSCFREAPVPTGRGNQTVYFRGVAILDAVLALASQLGLRGARNVTLTGASAGGTTTFLHLDRLAAFVASVAPAARVVGKPVAGYFIASNSSFNALLGGVYSMQNVTGSLSAECQAALAPDSWRCIIPSYAAQYVHTPFFAMQSRFDLWQLGSGEEYIPCMRSQPFTPPYHPSTCTPAEDAAITAFGSTLMSVSQAAHPVKSGAAVRALAMFAQDHAERSRIALEWTLTPINGRRFPQQHLPSLHPRHLLPARST